MVVVLLGQLYKNGPLSLVHACNPVLLENNSVRKWTNKVGPFISVVVLMGKVYKNGPPSLVHVCNPVLS